jgi:hypothetical protein
MKSRMGDADLANPLASISSSQASESRASPCQQPSTPFPGSGCRPRYTALSFPLRMLKETTRQGYRWKMSSLELAFGCEHELEKHQINEDTRVSYALNLCGSFSFSAAKTWLDGHLNMNVQRRKISPVDDL